MEYLIIIIILFALELFYFKIAARHNIIDKPNHRSSHTKVTLRGGGIISPLLFYYILRRAFYTQKIRFYQKNIGLLV